jgi:hypothetical protein
VVPPLATERASAKLPEKVKKTARVMLIKQLKGVIHAAVRPAWRGLVNQIQDRQGQLEEKSKSVCDPVSKARNEISDGVKDKVMKVLQPLVEKFGKVRAR